ncbi:Cytochrome P450 87A3 like [Actinidia chinensis var. chinensis]|uniref:Cytochrome P450 87A3 like n=1 Tax=Actinidia chinensis var. chinensis TaxID=1590841 RepID=A0A2R6R744_ACTCC|nr:Cytochrome P450 87A3 like [Actinidia chinensis var. chinensis]
MLLGFTLKQMFGYDSEKSAEDLSEKVVDFVHGLMSLPLNIPGPEGGFKYDEGDCKGETYFPRKVRGDFLDHAIEDMKTEKFLTEDFIVQLTLGILFASFEPISAVLVLTFSCYSGNILPS